MKLYLIILFSMISNFTFSQFNILSFPLINFPEDSFQCEIYETNNPSINYIFKRYISKNEKVMFEYFPIQFHNTEYTKYNYDVKGNLKTIQNKDSLVSSDSCHTYKIDNIYTTSSLTDTIKLKEYADNILYKYDGNNKLIQKYDSCTGIRFNRIFSKTPTNYYDNIFICGRTISYHYELDKLITITSSINNKQINKIHFYYKKRNYQKAIKDKKEKHCVLMNYENNPILAFHYEYGINYKIQYNFKSQIKKIIIYDYKTNKLIKNYNFFWKKLN